MSTYIDLNPIRAGIVDKPEDYRWCGYAAALAGDATARKGLAKIYSYRDGKGNRSAQWSDVRGDYRQALFERGVELLEDPDSGIRGRLGFSASDVELEIQRHGKLSSREVLLHRVRYFTDGAIIGSASFINEVFQLHRDNLTAKTSGRQVGAYRMRGADWGTLHSFRDLRSNVIGHPG